MTTTDAWSHETVLAAEPRSAALARHFVCERLLAHHLPHLMENVRLVVSELATNAVAHARTPFVVTLSCANEAVRVAVWDESTSVPVLSAPGALDTSGRGLMITEILCREWGISTDGLGCKSVWASFPSGPDEAKPAPTAA